ncbi:MAG: hypothetical protein DIU76_04095 [Bacillota bacterium]|nr:MAG: hypothetical protein DIU76_04095 [Bacillota bacterium]
MVDHLRRSVPSLEGRVYQAFLVDAFKEPRPYATVKVVPGTASTRISYAGHDEIEVRVYGDATDWTELDAVVEEVILALNGRDVEDPETGQRYEVAWIPGVNDFTEAGRPGEPLLARLVRFRAASLYERG